MSVLDTFEWDEAVKNALENFEWNDQVSDQERKHEDVGYDGVLTRIGCDYASLLMEIMNPYSVVKEPVTQQDASLLPQPRFSSISAADQAICLQYEEVFRLHAKNTSIPPNKKLQPKFRKLVKKGAFAWLREHLEFAEYALQNARNQLAMYNFNSQQVANFIQHRIAFSVLSMKSYMQSYIHNSDIVISITPYVNDPQPKYQNLTVLTGTSPPLITIPKCPAQLPNMPHNENDHLVWKISEDPNAAKLASKWKADIVLSLSSLRVLATNFQPFPEEWEIPMIIKMLEGRKVAFIDKPFVPKSLNARERNQIYFKRNFKNYLVKREKEKVAPQKVTPAKSPPQRFQTATKDSVMQDNRPNNRSQLKETVGVTNENLNNSKQSTESPDESSEEETETNNSSTIKEAEGSKHKQETDDNIKMDTTEPEVKQTSKQYESDSVQEFSESDSDGAGLSIADDVVDFPIPQLDGANDKKRKNPTRSSKRNKKNDEAASTMEGAKKAKKANTTNSNTPPTLQPTSSKTDVWQQSLSKFQVNPASKKPSLISSPPASIANWAKQSTSADSDEPTPSSSHMRCEESDLDLVIDSENEAPMQTKSPQADADKDAQGGLSFGLSQYSEFPSAIRDSFNESPITKTLLGTSVQNSTTKTGQKDHKKSPRIRFRKTTTKKTGKKVVKIDQNVGQNRKLKKSQSSSESKNEEEVNSSSDDLSEKEESLINPSPPQMEKSSAKKSLELAKQSNSLANFNKLKTMMKDQFSKSSPIDPSPQGKRPIAPKKSAEKEKPAGDLLGQILNMQSEKKDATRQNKAKEKPSMPAEEDHIQPVEHLDKQELQARSDGQVCFYTLWSFADVRVLIRGTVHGEMMVKTDKKPAYKSSVVIRSKLEYQHKLGYEQMTLYEACAEWSHLQFRPKPSVILRCHIDPAKEIMMCTKVIKEISELSSIFEVSCFSDRKAMKLLTVVFQKLSSPSYLPSSYLICHKCGGKYLLVRRGETQVTDKMVVYELPKEYSNPGCYVRCGLNNLPYVPLDPLVQSPWQKKHKIVPLTFQAPPEKPGEKSGAPAKKKKKKSKKAKKSLDSAAGQSGR